MAGFLERMRRSWKQIVKQSISTDPVPSRVLELQTAKEILAEIFSTDISDVEEMIQMRCEKLESYPRGSMGRRVGSSLRFGRSCIS